MFYEWLYPLHTVQGLSFLNLFKYITVRSALAAVLALLISFVLGPPIIRWLRSKVHIPIIADEACLHPTDIPRLADAYEAVIGAIYLDGGYDDARDFILREFKDDLGESDTLPSLTNLPPGILQTTVGDAEAMGELFQSFGLAMATGGLVISCNMPSCR